MKSSKPIEISKSSLISLKAELSRKQDEVSKAKLQNQTSVIRPLPRPKKETIWTKKNSGVGDRNEKDAEELKEERDIHQLSRSALEAKSKLYEKLSKSGATEENTFLVDFQQKQATQVEQEQEEEETYSDDEPASDPENDWVDYEDCLGRTRRCLRKDLDFVKQKDAHLFTTLFDNKTATETAGNEHAELQSGDMRRELLRQKWEEQEQRLRDKSDIHYQDVLFDEARSHGVGYYSFSQDETQRKAQQEALSKLRDETARQQEAARTVRDRREQQLQARLKAARRRKRARLGLALESDSDHEEEADEVNDTVESKEEEKEVVVEVVRKVPPVRPWDIGKEGVVERQVLSQEEWVAKKRQERPQDFAPPSSYKPDYNPTSLYFTSKQSYTNIVNEVEQPPVRQGVEIAPPPTYTSVGQSRKPFGAMKGAELQNSITAGLRYLRQQAEERQRQNEKGMLDIV